MKKWIISSLLVLFAFPLTSNAAKDWKKELEDYKAYVETGSTGYLWLQHAKYSTLASAVCATDMVISGASYIADTTPVLNGLSEMIANTVSDSYQTRTYDTIFSWEGLAKAGRDIGRGTAGGGAIAVWESLQFVGHYLAGSEKANFEATKKVYASSLATTEALFSQQGKCMTSMSKVMIIRNLLQERKLAAAKN